MRNDTCGFFGAVAAVFCGISAASAADCPRDRFADVGGTPVWKAKGVLAFRSGLMIDADGAPNAYGPDGKGLDHLANAGKPGNWWAIVTEDGKPSGQPVVQSAADPFPGYYVSATALEDSSKPVRSPARYVDSGTVPYLALSPKVIGKLGARLGDFAAVHNVASGRTRFAIVADVGPKEKIGEGSIALAEALGVPSSPKRGGTPRGIAYVIFPRSGNGKPRPVAEIDAEARRLLDDVGGVDALLACTAD